MGSNFEDLWHSAKSWVMGAAVMLVFIGAVLLIAKGCGG